MQGRMIGATVLTGLLLAAPAAGSAKLQRFESCPALLGYAHAHASKMVATGWLPPAGGPIAVARPIPGPQGKNAAPQETAGAAPAPATPDFSTTNVQEQGVDEPDIVKTDGKVVYAIANGRLEIVDARADTPRLLGSLALDEGSGHELLLYGNRLLVLQNAWLPGPVPQPDPATKQGASGGIARPIFLSRGVTRLTEVDVSTPSAPKVVRTERFDGSYVTARMDGATARVVLSSPSRVFEPMAAMGLAARGRAVRRSALAPWRPRAFFRDRRRAHTALRPAVACGDVRYPPTFSGVDMLTVLTVDLARGLPVVDSDAVMTDAETVYGSPSKLYVATRRWLSPQAMEQPTPPKATTTIHAFDASNADQTDYRGSGSVPGYLLGQFAMSESNGQLRVASTTEPEWAPDGGASTQSESLVTVLEPRDGALAQVSQLGGLGRGERIYAVRFIDDVGYVVTFKQVDPLFTIDLSDPAKPRVAGELKLAGYSAYLHPVGKGLLLGVGQDAGEDGRTRGTQLSLFDVSNPASPSRVASYALGTPSSSEVEFDHHAFLWWAPTKLAVLPVQAYSDKADGSQGFSGAIGFRVDRSGIGEVGRVSHPAGAQGYVAQIRRSIVLGPKLLTVSDGGLLASPLDTLAGGSFVAFPPPPDPGPQPLGASGSGTSAGAPAG